MSLKEFISRFFGKRLEGPILTYADLDQKQKKVIAQEYLKEKTGTRDNDKIYDEIIKTVL